MKLSIVTAQCGPPDITLQWLEETIGCCETAPEVCVVFNGCRGPEITPVTRALEDMGATWRCAVRNEPLGSTKAYNEGIHMATGNVVAMLHNDLMVRQRGWDVAVLEWFKAHPLAGVAGFHGATELGHPMLYKVPYELVQLARGGTLSNLEDAESHGARSERPREVVTLDGMALIARRVELRAWGGLDERFVHHCYDHDLCLTARKYGWKNYMLPVVARHISGQTANSPRYNDHFEGRGRDAGIHAQAHLDFYRKWADTGQLPARI